jgi:hypothetical protein
MGETYTLKLTRTGQLLFTLFGSLFLGFALVALIAYRYRGLPEWKLLTMIYSGIALVVGGALYFGIWRVQGKADIRILDRGLEIKFHRHSVFHPDDLLIRWDAVRSATVNFESENNTYYYYLKTDNPKRFISLQFMDERKEVADTGFWISLKQKIFEQGRML